MTVETLYDEIEFATETDSGTFSDADKLRGLNIDQGEALFLMLSAQGFRKVGEKEYYCDFPVITGLVEGNSGYQGEFAFDSTWVKITEIYVKFPSSTIYRQCKLYDVSENDNSEFDETEIKATFSELNPYARYARETFLIRPLNTVSTVANGIKVLAEPRNGTLTATSDTPIMDSIFHRWYVLKEALRFGQFRTGVSRVDVENELNALESKIKRHYSEKLKTPTKVKVINESFK